MSWVTVLVNGLESLHSSPSLVQTPYGLQQSLSCSLIPPPHCSQNILTKRQGVCILHVHLERVTAWHAQTSLYSLAFEPEIFEVSSFVAVSYCWLTDDPESQWLKTTAIYLTLSILYLGSWGWALLASSLGFNWSCSWVCGQLEVNLLILAGLSTYLGPSTSLPLFFHS